MNETSGRLLEGDQGSVQDQVAKWTPLIIGGALVLYGLSRRSRGGALVAAAGGALAYQGNRATAAPKKSFARTTVLINASPHEIYNFWKDLENLPRFMRHLESVTKVSETESKWTAIGPAGYRVQWTAETVSDQPGQHIAWRSKPGSEIELDGTVEFHPAPGDRGTIVDVTMQYQTPAGVAGNVLAKLFGKGPEFLMRQDLRRLKALLEAGEIPTTDGQPHGPRSIVAAAARMIDRDNPVASGSNLSEVADARRKVS